MKRGYLGLFCAILLIIGSSRLVFAEDSLLINNTGKVVYFEKVRLAVSPAPEPISMSLFLTGGGILLFFGRPRRKK